MTLELTPPRVFFEITYKTPFCFSPQNLEAPKIRLFLLPKLLTYVQNLLYSTLRLRKSFAALRESRKMMQSIASKHIRKATLFEEGRGAFRRPLNLATTVRAQREKKGDQSVSIRNFKVQLPARERTINHEERLTIRETLLLANGTEGQVHELSCSQLPRVPRACEPNSPTPAPDH